MDGWVTGLIDVYLMDSYRWMNGLTDRGKDGHINRPLDGWIDGSIAR